MIPRPFIRFAVTAFQSLRRSIWFFTRPRVSGVHAVPVTPEGRVVLVRLTYAQGWRLPGGGRKKGEEAVAGILRELREEIGLTGHGAVEPIADFERQVDYRKDLSSLFLVRDVEYRPRRSLEIDEVGEFDPAALPEGATAWTRGQIAALGLGPSTA